MTVEMMKAAYNNTNIWPLSVSAVHDQWSLLFTTIIGLRNPCVWPSCHSLLSSCIYLLCIEQSRQTR